MINKLRKKITGLLTLLFVIAYTAFAVIFIYTDVQSDRVTVSHLLTNHLQIAVSTGVFSNTNTAPMNGIDHEDISKDSVIYLIEKTSDGMQIKERFSSSISDTEILAEAQKCLDTGNTSGTSGAYQFEITSINQELVIALMDITSYHNKISVLVWEIVLIGIGVSVLWGLLAWEISSLFAEPLVIANEKQNDFIMSAGHELKTPVTVMKTSLDLMQEEGVESKYLNYAIEENERMKQLIIELLDYAKLTDKDQKRLKKKVDLSACTEASVLPFEAMAYEKGIHYETEIDRNIYIKGYVEQLSRMIEVLIENAIRYTKKEDTVKVLLKTDGRNACLSVSNQGEPISESQKDKIFEKFYRSNEVEQTEDHYGLGLAIAESIALEHDSSIQVNSKEGWNTFSLIFHIH